MTRYIISITISYQIEITDIPILTSKDSDLCFRSPINAELATCMIVSASPFLPSNSTDCVVRVGKEITKDNALAVYFWSKPFSYM